MALPLRNIIASFCLTFRIGVIVLVNMPDLLLYHVSDTLREVLEPPNDKRPLFYWYCDRLFSHYGLIEYVYFCVINPRKQNIALRSRSNAQDFDGLHKDFVYYRDFCDGKTELTYAEPGIAMSFSRITPTITLRATDPENTDTQYEIMEPEQFSAKPFSVLGDQQRPIKFSQIPELANYLKDCIPVKEIRPDEDGRFLYEDWLPMTTTKGGVWL